jgi:hypothetical protein
MTSIEHEVKPTNLLRRLAETYELLIGSNRHWHAAAVSLAIEHIENQLRLQRRLRCRISELQAALDAECVARDKAEAKAHA